MMMSIFPLFLLMGVAISRHISYYMDTAALQPIVTRSQERRICAELCMSGLGGTPCGDDCVDISPQGLPLQSLKANRTVSFSAITRQDSCSILCENNLGYPLCRCDHNNSNKSKANFAQICSYFCTNYDYMIYGCQSCSLYKEASASDMMLSARLLSPDDDQVPVVDWSLWCQKMCQDGDGGAACNCDLLPMSMDL
ncbi:hypothetical protein NQ314_002611 [Rhamnusium bicolor]|uniref:Uncharacterized protein n=1 Tax=Rhamnusium bicolor TaxID=1586634 RepID=A0AAV8ZQF7_9CUCU|nr:hypothetical protein NQ314_002611 [Rhamnusium bicolor]